MEDLVIGLFKNIIVSLINIINVPVLDEAGTHLTVRCPSQPDRDLWRLGREIERPRPLETWPSDRDL